MLDALGRGASRPDVIAVIAGFAAMVGWALLGVVLLGVAARRCGSIIRRHEAMLAEGDRMLAAEDEAAAAPPPTGDAAPPAADAIVDPAPDTAPVG